MRKALLALFISLFTLPAYLFSYNYGELVELPNGVKELLPATPDILASATADLNGDKQADFVLILQDNGPVIVDSAAKAPESEANRVRQLLVITAKDGGYAVAARTDRAVLCSGCGAPGEDPFLALSASTESFTILHQMGAESGEPWGIAAKFGYSRRDGRWRLAYFSAGAGPTPASFGPITLEDYDVNYYMQEEKVEARPLTATAFEARPDDILYTENGTAYTLKPDGSGKRYLAGDRFYRQMRFPCWSRDKKRVAFIRNNDMYVMDVKSGDERRLFRDVLKSHTYRYVDEGKVSGMRWSPDGKMFAVTGYKSTVNHVKKYMYIYGPDGAARTVKESDKDAYIGSFSWSPDSDKLAYYRGTTLTVMDVGSGDEKELFPGPGSGVAWSEDGKRLLTAQSGAFAIIDAESGNARTVKCIAWSGYGPLFWSKDEKIALYYSSDNILKIRVEEGAKPVPVNSRESGLIDGMSW